MSFATTRAATWRAVKGHHAVAAGLAAGLALMAAAGGWQLRTDGNGSAPVAHPVSSVATTRADPAPVFYIVSSEAEARNLLRGLEDAALIRVENGDFATQFTYEILISPDRGTLQTIVLENDVRSAAGLPAIRLTDLRAGTK